MNSVLTEKRLLILTTLLVIAALQFGAWTIQQRFSSAIYEEVGNKLNRTVDAAELSLERWFNNQSAGVRYWASQSEVEEAVRELSAVPHDDGTGLLSSPGQKRLRDRFVPLMGDLGYLGFFIVDSDNYNLASSRDSNVGIKSLLEGQPEFFARMREGDVALSLPLYSDVPLDDETEQYGHRPVTMFVGAPLRRTIRGEKMFLLFRLSVPNEFNALFRRLKFGGSGEVYAFDAQGRLLTISRYEEQLYRMGILPQGEGSQLALQLRVPDSGALSELVAAIVGQQPVHGVVEFEDYRGVDSVGQGRWLAMLNMGIGAKLDAAEAGAALATGRSLMQGMTWGGSILILIFSTFLYLTRRKNWQIQSNLSAVLQNSGEGIITIDRNAKIETVNPAAAAMFGYDVSEIVGRNVNKLMPHEMRRQHDEYVQQSELYESRVINRSRELYGLHKDGRLIPIELNVTRMQRNGEERFIGILHDISERVDAQRALQRNEDLLQRSQHIAHVGSWDWGIEDGDITWTDETYRLFGADKGEDSPSYELFMSRVHPEDRDHVAHCIEAALSGEFDPYDLEHRILTRDGEVRYVHEVGRVYRDESGKAVRMIGVVQDITAQVDAAERIQQEKEAAEEANEILSLTHQVLERTGIAEFWFRASDGRLVWVSDEGGKHLGYSMDELRAMSISDFDPGFPQAQWRELMRPYVEQGWGRFESTHQTKGGASVPVEITAMYRPEESDAEAMFVAFVTNIAERKAVEAELIQSRENAEAAVQAKSAFLATMSHEIRTPMNGVVGMIELLRNTPLNEEQQRMLGVVHDSAFSLLRIIDDILDLSKIEAGKLKLEQTSFSLDDVIDSVADIIRPIARSKNIRFYLYQDPNLNLPLIGDPVRIRQILYNLCGNAIKFTNKENGYMAVDVSRLEGGNGVNIQIRFRVKDNGIGMSEEVTQRLFSPFFQAEASTTRRFGGTGLGLSICKNLTEMMGGGISVESVEHKGTTFTVDLPFVCDRTAIVPSEPVISDLSVLCLVPDEYEFKNVNNYVNACGCDSRVVSTDEALWSELDGGHSYDVVLLFKTISGDKMEPLLKRLREQSAGQLRYVLAVPDELQYRELKDDDVILVENYPLKRRALHSAIASAVGRASPPVGSGDEPINVAVAPPSREMAQSMNRLILVAEDNLTNQEVILRQLWLLGYAADIAADGRQGLQMWREEEYALVLTDCHMPVMDGYQMTAAIREDESVTGRNHTPIIAVTANALQGEGDKCIQCGMDGYLSKPLELKRLRRELAKWVEPLQQQDEGGVFPSGEEVNGEGLVRLDVLTEYVGSDSEVQQQILKKFLQTARDTVSEINDAIAEDDLEQVGLLAHRIKSSARALGAEALVSLLQTMEQAGKEERREEILAQQQSLAPLLEKLENEIATLLA